MKRDERPDFEKLSKGQLGLVTSAQLERAGYTIAAIKWAIADKRIARVHTGVYRLVGSTQTWNQTALAAVLYHPPGTVLSHATAAKLWNVEGLRAEHPIHVLPPKQVNLKLPPRVVRHRSNRAFDVHWHGPLPSTTLARTLLDVAESLDDEALEIALDSAQYRRPFLEQDLEDLIGTRKRKDQPGAQRIIDLLDLRAGVSTESPLETKVRRALRKASVPSHQLQLDIFDGKRRVVRADFAWPQHRVVLHCDGYTWHGKRRQFDLDAEQRSTLAAIDWVSLIVTDRTLKSGEWLVSLRRTLERRDPQQKLL